MKRRKTKLLLSWQLPVQIAIFVGCAWVLALLAARFPYPSPVIQPFLGPQKRWPAHEVDAWVKSGHVDSDFLAFFMRDPDRAIPPGRNVVAPADGKILDIVRQSERAYIVIALTYWDVHVQRSPADATVIAVDDGGNTYMNGEGYHLHFLPHKLWPVQKIVTLKTAWGLMRVRLVTSLMARRIRIFVHKGQQVKKGQRIGRILLGSTVVLELPPQMTLGIREGEHVTAGETIVSKGARR